MELIKAFENIYNENAWGGEESRSGPGSGLNATQALRRKLPDLVAKYQIKTFVDAPCGDFFWMKELVPALTPLLDQYIGVDIVSSVVQQNTERYGNEKFSFRQMDITTSVLPKADIIFTRDCFLHLSYENISKVLAAYKASGSKYLMTSYYTDPVPNQNCPNYHMEGRHLNLELRPFNFGKPLELVNEETVEPIGWTDKHMGLWEIQSLPIPMLDPALDRYIPPKPPSIIRRIRNRLFR